MEEDASPFSLGFQHAFDWCSQRISTPCPFTPDSPEFEEYQKGWDEGVGYYEVM